MIYSGRSKSLEALRMVEQVCLVANVANMEEQFELLEKYLIALEIIKKRFRFQFFKSNLSNYFGNYYGIMQIGINPIYIETKEQFELLEKIFGGEK